MYKLTFCDPFAPSWMELENFPPEKVLDKFEEIRWSHHLGHSRACQLREYFSPSFCVENLALKRGIECWAVDNDRGPEWFVFYKRPETIRTWLGLRRQYREDYVSNTVIRNKEEVIRCLQAFVRNDFEFLSRKVR